jgi:hypothetical protein
MPLPGLHDRPDQRFRRLAGQPHRAGTAADAAVGWSFTLLTGDEQLLQGRHWVLGVGADWAGSSHDGALGQPGKG